jgi:hypothetical protein
MDGSLADGTGYCDFNTCFENFSSKVGITEGVVRQALF